MLQSNDRCMTLESELQKVQHQHKEQTEFLHKKLESLHCDLQQRSHDLRYSEEKRCETERDLALLNRDLCLAREDAKSRAILHQDQVRYNKHI